MKTYFIFLCVIISGGIAEAATQTSLNQDKPSYLYIKSYTEGNACSTTVFQMGDNCLGGAQTTSQYATDNANWANGSAFTYSANIHGLSLYPNGSVCASMNVNVNISWPTLYSTICTGYQLINGYTNTGPFGYAPLFLEHCDIGYPLVDGSGTFVFFGGTFTQIIKATESRTAQAIMHLQTGGKATSKLRNLFAFSGVSATSIGSIKVPGAMMWDGPYTGNYDPWSFQYTLPTSQIPLQNIVIGSFGALNASGVLYKSLPDNADLDVTPYVAGVDYYTFGVSATKYNSYFEVFVNQPYPGTQITLSDYTGHAFWQFKTDAPADALQSISPSLTNFVNHSWGFYPHGADCGLPGWLQNDDSHTYQVERVFYIGFFPDLINGLQFARGISNAPPEYCYYSYSCIGATQDAGRNAGITLPSGTLDLFPQNFGADIVTRFPGPLVDDTPRYSK